MKLMIIESPGKIKKLSAILGSGWEIAASVGHIRDLPKHDMGVEAPDFKPTYELTERGESVITKLKALVKTADAVYLATDPDREGESISWHLKECLKLKNPLRVTFNEITQSAVKAALNAPRAIDVKRVASQEARRVLDRLVGYTASPEVSLYAGQQLSAGRVQSPAVRLVVEREREIRAFRTTNHFGAALFFADAKMGSTWSAEWVLKPDFISEEQPYFMDKAFAQAVADVKAVVVSAVDERERRRNPPPPFTTASLQQAASVVLGMVPKATMDAAQKLYEQGHISYHRTDNPNVSDDALGDIYAVAVKAGLDMADKPRKFEAPEGAQVGHPAITPTHWEAEEAGETPEQRALYRLIRLRAIACQLADARYAVRTVRLDATQPVEGRAVTFQARGRTLVYPGWLKLIPGDQTEKKQDDKEPENSIPACQPGEKLTAQRGELLAKKTKAPSRYTQATLIKKLESEGIGRPATYATIMDNIVSRAYVEENEALFLAPTATGELVVDSLAGQFEFIDLGFTRNLEQELDRIACGDNTYKGVIAKVHNQLSQEVMRYRAKAIPKFPCPECGKPLRRVSWEGRTFWGCSGRPTCTVTLPDEDGKPGHRSPQETTNFACGECGKPLAHRVKTGKDGYDFWGCTGYREGCKQTYENKNGEPDFTKAK